MIRVFLVDDHELVREGIKRIINAQADLQVVGEASGAKGLLLALESFEADVLVLDLGLRGRSGFSILEELRQRRPKLPVLVLSMYPEADYSARVLRAGASGFVSKGRPMSDLIAAIRLVAGGERYVSPAAQQAVDRAEAKGLPHETLSDREAEVFRRIADGATPAEIAQELGISPGTVGTYVFRIKEKLNVSSIGEIVQYAYRNRLVD